MTISRTVVDDELLVFPVQDSWATIPADLRHEFLTRRTESTRPHRGQRTGGIRWEPLRPLIIEERAYRHLETLAARLLHLAVDACCRRASTAGELYELLRFPHDLPLLDPDRPLVAAELTRYARPDLLIEQGRPQFLELNNSNRLGGMAFSSRLAEAYAQLCPKSGLYSPPSAVTARFAAMARRPRTDNGRDTSARALIPSYRATDRSRTVRLHRAKRATLDAVRRTGLDAVEADLADLRVGATGRLLAAGVPIDVVLLEWGGNRIRHDDGGLAALRAADRAGTVALFPRTESALISSKAVLAWLHEDCEAGLLSPADEHLVRAHVPWTVCLGLNGDSSVPPNVLCKAAAEREQLIVKPAVDRAGKNVFFGRRASNDDWLPALVRAAHKSPLVLQRRVEPDLVPMPFLDPDSRQQVTAQVPYVLSPFVIDGAAASVLVRHTTPGAPIRDVVIDTRLGARANTVLLAP
ncbi:hypothetical protein [Pseudonocardia alaniniphila]|uniref:Circularly permuted ATP-grasp superfamily protein n=1 Tax=Pseudonocardia alaniniphila TaxID=75291 RepID=A0ABS9T8U4_9PSEU|nr:hypothetical protein [Pseudonocardia alaniniphila]MCH6164962.1 hypothetical protein [Pseudonocardia alaniniphila]